MDLSGINIIAALGVGSLGGVVGILIGLYAAYLRSDQPKNLTVLIGAIGAAAVFGVLTLFREQAGLGMEIYFYPIGLLAGFVVGFLISVIYQLLGQ